MDVFCIYLTQFFQLCMPFFDHPLTVSSLFAKSFWHCSFVLRALQLLCLLRLLMFRQEIITSLLSILQIPLPRFFEHTLRHISKHSQGVSQLVEQVFLSEIIFSSYQHLHALPFFLFCERATFISVFTLHPRCPSICLELFSSLNSGGCVSFAQ